MLVLRHFSEETNILYTKKKKKFIKHSGFSNTEQNIREEVEFKNDTQPQEPAHVLVFFSPQKVLE